MEPEHRGKVVWYDRVKSYGFLAIDGMKEDLFLHGTEVRKAGLSADDLLKGTAIRCNVGTDSKTSRTYACDLKLGE